MSNHSEFPPDSDFIRQMRATLENEPLKGATGQFPEGKLTKLDEGGIQFAIGNRDGKVVMDFGKPVHWVGMTPQDACDLAQHLIRQARNAARVTGEPISVNIA